MGVGTIGLKLRADSDRKKLLLLLSHKPRLSKWLFQNPMVTSLSFSCTPNQSQERFSSKTMKSLLGKVCWLSTESYISCLRLFTMPSDRLGGSGPWTHGSHDLCFLYFRYSLMSSLYASRKTKTVGSSLNRLGSFHFAEHWLYYQCQ